jgi:transcription termination factor NusB
VTYEFAEGEVVEEVTPKPAVEQPKMPKFETRQEAEAYARTMGFTNVSFSGVDMRATNEWMQAMTYYKDNFPEIFSNMQATGTSTDAFRNAKKKIIAKWREDNKNLIEKFGEDWAKRRSTKYANTIIPRTPSNCWALSIESNDTVDKYDLAGVYINKNNFRKYSYEKIMEYKEEEVRTNMHPAGTGTFRSDLDHEIGHQLDYFVGVSDDTEFINSLFEGVDNQYSYVRENLSSYGASRNTEMVAEAWSEYMNNPNPRPLAIKIGDYIVRKYRRMFP